MVTKYFELLFCGSMETKRVNPRQIAERNPVYKIYLLKEVQCLVHEKGTIHIYICMCVYIYIYTHTHTHTHTHTYRKKKPNCLKFLFPQNGYNVRLKAVHILNAPPFADVVIALVKRVLKSKLAARVSDLNRLHFSICTQLCYINIYSLLSFKVQHLFLLPEAFKVY